MTNSKNITITVVGSGYVGMSLAVLLSQSNNVIIYDIDPNRIDIINNGKSTISDKDIKKFLSEKKLNIRGVNDKKTAYMSSKFIIVATPTNYDEGSNKFDTSSVDGVVEDAIKLNPKATIIIKSTIPVGHTNYLQRKHSTQRIIFSPEFLREGKALHDNLWPSRIIIGSESDSSKEFTNLLSNASNKKNVEILTMSSTEAEAVKLFANTYLAMRVSFFNELDSFSMAHNLNTKNIINGVCLDERIGMNYNNPSFGYGGYCLPKDTKQLLANYDQVPQTLIQAIVSSNKTRKDFIASQILKLKPKVVGFYKLVMKDGSDNFRSSAIQGVIQRVKAQGIEVVVYEPQLSNDIEHSYKIIDSLDHFKNISDVIVANRNSKLLKDTKHKIFTRDLFGVN